MSCKSTWGFLMLLTVRVGIGTLYDTAVTTSLRLSGQRETSEALL